MTPSTFTAALTTIALAAVSLMATAAVAQAGPPPRPVSQCFRSHDYQGFRAVNDHAFNISLNSGQVFHIETQGTCPSLLSPGAFLITTIRGSDEICGPLDWDLKIGESGPGDIPIPCLVKSQTRLTPAEVAAIPPRERP
jgi:hypothetical protein